MTNTLYERRYQVETSNSVRLEDLGISAKNRVHYVPSGWSSLRRILRRNEILPNDVLVDFGSGMGRIVLMASMRPFRRVIGVELSLELGDISRENIRRNQERLVCGSVEIVTSDVLDFEIPNDMTYAFLYNPFKGEIFDAVIANIIHSVDRHPRVVRIIYRDPEEESRLLDTGRVRLVRKAPGFRPGRDWSRAHAIRMYEVLPRAGHLPSP